MTSTTSAARLFRKVALLCLVAVLAACASTRGGSVPYDVTDFGIPGTERPAPPVSQAIGAGDTLTVQVYQLSDLNGDVIVDAAGNITIPLIGSVVASGKTPAQLQSDIAGKLTTYIRSPAVTVSMKQAVTRTVTVEGSVARPGLFAVNGVITLLQAVALGGGPTEDANPRRVVVFRRIAGERQAAAFDLLSIRRNEAPDPDIFGNDIIVVDGSDSKSQFRTLIQTLPLLSLFRVF